MLPLPQKFTHSKRPKAMTVSSGTYASTRTTNSLLWKQMKLGNEKAFAALFKKWYNDLYYYGLKIVQDETLVKDAIQDVFLEVWSSRTKLSDATHPKIYLTTSLRRRLIRLINKNKKEYSQKREAMEHYHNFELTVEDFIITSEQNDHKINNMRKGIQQLTKTQKEVVFLKYYNGFDDREISEILNIKYQSVRNTVHRALVNLRKVLG